MRNPITPRTCLQPASSSSGKSRCCARARPIRSRSDRRPTSTTAGHARPSSSASASTNRDPGVKGQDSGSRHRSVPAMSASVGPATLTYTRPLPVRSARKTRSMTPPNAHGSSADRDGSAPRSATPPSTRGRGTLPPPPAAYWGRCDGAAGPESQVTSLPSSRPPCRPSTRRAMKEA